MKGYKGFNPGLVCRGKQYAENTVFEEPSARICHSGMHFCENPFDVLDHYGLVRNDGSFNEFAEVEALADTVTDDHKKFNTTKLKIGAKLTMPGFIKACIDFVQKKTIVEMPDSEGSSGDSAKIGSSGYLAQIGSSGNFAQIDCSGDDSVICCAGNNSVVKANLGCWITLAEWKWDDEKKRLVPVCVKTEFVDGERIKADVFYKLSGGEFVEVQ